MELPPGTADRLLAQVRLLMVRQVTSPWWEGYGHATTYREQHDHLDVPADHVTDNGHRLGRWILNARQHHRKGWMPADRITALNRLGMIWHTRDQANEQLIAHARAYHTAHGHLRVPRDHVTEDGYPLGSTLKIRRSRCAHGAVHTDVVQALDELGMMWDLREALSRCRGYRRLAVRQGVVEAAVGCRSGRSGQAGSAGDLVPDREPDGHLEAVVGCGAVTTAGSEVG
ncbi:helicase associated domain-containing protein [Streptomyces sp. CLV115]|uniref:helicase associated domain-containing protein n=2 Tax=Streptomyces sp. CLV115 TaxID=3138502 RepID=UPI00313DCB97